MIQINAEQVIKWHEDVIRETGGSSGLRDAGSLESAIASAFQTFGGTEFYPSDTSKIARIVCGIIRNHPFVDGNKRTGTFVLLALLRINDIHTDLTNNDIVQIALALAKGEMDDGQLDELIRGRVR